MYHCYRYQINAEQLGQNCWVSNLKHMLFSFGYGYAWLFQGIGDESLFLEHFTQRAKDIYFTNWRNSLEDSPNLASYKEFKTLLNPERYLTIVKSFFVRKQLAKFRCSNHKLAIEEGRYKNIPSHLRICTCCKTGYVEDEYHFIMVCPTLATLRLHLIPPRYIHYPPWRKFEELLMIC